MKASEIVRRIRGEARDRGSRAKRELTRPWREGRSGPPAEIGRWLGLGLAVGAAIVGVAAGLQATRRG